MEILFLIPGLILIISVLIISLLKGIGKVIVLFIEHPLRSILVLLIMIALGSMIF